MVRQSDSDSHFFTPFRRVFYQNWGRDCICNFRTSTKKIFKILFGRKRNVLESGEIRHENYNNDESLKWEIYSDCENAVIKSIKFNTERGYDYLSIHDENFSGTKPIEKHVPGHFTVSFESDELVTKSGFILIWNCINTENFSGDTDGSGIFDGSGSDLVFLDLF